MCRFAAYAGAARPLSSLLYDPPHSLEVQAYRPLEMLSGHVNVDGTGVAWWRGGEAAPLRYVSERPPWSDANLPHLASRLSGTPVLAAVRSQTPGMPPGAAAAHPFVLEGYAGAHNGYLQGFEQVAGDLIERIDPDVRRHLGLMTDSYVLFLIAVSELARGASLAEAVVGAAAAGARACAAQGRAASLNLALADASGVVALRAARGVGANSLYTLENGARWPDGRLIASEPLDDDPGWTAVPEDHLVHITADSVTSDAVTL